MKRFIIILTVFLISSISLAQATDYSNDQEFLALREEMHHAFNDGDSARFFPAIKKLENYLQKKGDLHGYYTQRCNEIVFLMNQQRILEAYIMAREMSKELRERDLDKEMYMAVNMLGHINRYCGNKEAAKKNWYEVLDLMDKQGYYSSKPPIYMNIVNVALDDSPEEADSLLEVAKSIARKYSPDRVFDIETRQSLSYYYRGDMKKFVEGYKSYKKGVAEGLSSVHGRSMEVLYLAYMGHTDEACTLATKELGDEGLDVIPQIYANAGRWQEAYEALKRETEANDSIDNVVLTRSMMGIREEIMLHEAYRENNRMRMIGLGVGILLLVMLIFALVYIVNSRRKHLRELEQAYQRAMESEKLKSAFIQNISHEIRTPLNIISGFSQVIADPELTDSVEERRHMSEIMQKNARQITQLMDEIIGLSLIESTEKMKRGDRPEINHLLRSMQKEYQNLAAPNVLVKLETTLDENFTMTTNENMLRRIITSLLENAVKYTEKGTITMRASHQDNRFILEVEDTGCGIPKEEAENIFGRFVKLNSFKEGIGLGLPLCRKLAEQLDGSVELDTNYTEGARFIVMLPIL